jgi:hypothetical protein
LTDNNIPGHDLTGFVLNFRSFNGQTDIQGEAFTLPLDRIRVRAIDFLGLSGGTSNGYQLLATGWLPLFSYTDLTWSDLSWSTHQLTISYDCGTGLRSLLGEKPDYYNVEVELELMPTGSGF